MSSQTTAQSVLASFLQASGRHRCLALDTGLAALDSRRWLTRKASRRIWMSSFLWRNDRSGNFLLTELAARARAGVEVRILLDHWGTMGTSDGILPRLKDYIQSEPVEVRLFNPIVQQLNPSQWQIAMAFARAGGLLNHRMHGKIALFDDQAAIAGGRNVGDEYFDLHTFRCFHDAELLISGPSVEKFQASFDDFWNSPLTASLSDFQDGPSASRNHAQEPDAAEDWEEFREIADNCDLDYTARVFEPAAIDVTCDTASVDQQPPTATADATFDFFMRARHKLQVTSPILIFRGEWLKRLLKLRQANPDLELSLVTNSLVSTDNLFTYAAGLRQRRRLLRDLKVRLHEISAIPQDIPQFVPTYPLLKKSIEQADEQPESGFGSNRFECRDLHTTLHAKFAVADGHHLLLGSPNLDPRSLICNTELVVAVDDHELAQYFGKIHDRWRLNRNSWIVAETARWGIPDWLARFFLAWHRWTGWGRWPYGHFRSFAPHATTPDEIPVPADDQFHQHYENQGRYPGVKDTERQVEVEFLENVSLIFRELL